MGPDSHEDLAGTTEEPGLVSGRFLSDFFSALQRQGIGAAELLGDLPISLGEKGQVRGPIEWSHFADFMKRLERRLDGPSGLEACAGMIGELAPSTALRGLAGSTASPYALYYAASQWALRRALPGIEAQLTRVDDGHIEIVARIRDGLRPCPQIFHFATGGARCLPRLIGLPDAVVSASVGEREAHYRIAIPPSRSLFAHFKRVFRAVFSAGSILHYLEAQQLELHAKNDALQRAHDALAASERRYRALTDAAVDVLCEIDAAGQVVYVSASIYDLIGYTPEQVANSHYRLWIPRNFQTRATGAFERLFLLPEGRAVQERVQLHTESGNEITAELTARTYDAPDGDRRIVCILRDVSERGATAGARPRRMHDPHHELRGHLANPETSPQPPHALERSLEQLVARLDEWVAAARPATHDTLDEATRRMTYIVDAAVAQSTDPAAGFQWIETRKLLQSVHDEFCARTGAWPGAHRFEVQIDLSDAPSEIWTRPSLLDTALASLLDWAVERIGRGGENDPMPTIHMSAEVTSDQAHSTRVVLCVRPSSPGPSQAEHSAGRTSPDSEFGQLALAIAADAVEGLGGKLTSIEGAYASSRLIQLPQPPATERPR